MRRVAVARHSRFKEPIKTARKKMSIIDKVRGASVDIIKGADVSIFDSTIPKNTLARMTDGLWMLLSKPTKNALFILCYNFINIMIKLFFLSQIIDRPTLISYYTTRI
jgi:hypothetical protein